jgi:hypothetical protein
MLNYSHKIPSSDEFFINSYPNPTIADFNRFVSQMQEGYESEIINLTSQYPEFREVLTSLENNSPISEQSQIKKAIESKIGRLLL